MTGQLSPSIFHPLSISCDMCSHQRSDSSLFLCTAPSSSALRGGRLGLAGQASDVRSRPPEVGEGAGGAAVASEGAGTFEVEGL